MKELVLAFETSCDETCAAVVDSNLNILSNVVSSQIDIHKLYGGVVPEVASRNHLLSIESVLDEALQRANVKIEQITRIAATTQPGLVGAVMVGRVFAESVATALEKPFIEVNHLIGHIASVILSNPGLKPPFLALIVSGGHTSIYAVESYKKIKLLGSTTDDACGEAFDKVAKVLGLPYPGGPQISRLAAAYYSDANNRSTNNQSETNLRFLTKANYAAPNFSYSGLKTAVLNYVNKKRQSGEELNVPEICAAFQNEAVEQLVVKCMATLKSQKKYKSLAICGGVSANKYLREAMTKTAAEIGAKVFLPDISLCGDNAAMIAAAALLFSEAKI